MSKLLFLLSILSINILAAHIEYGPGNWIAADSPIERLAGSANQIDLRKVTGVDSFVVDLSQYPEDENDFLLNFMYQARV